MRKRTSFAAGIFLAGLSLGLFVLSWFLFEAGKPGAPEFSDARTDYGVDAGVRVYLPSAAGVKSINTKVYFKDVAGETSEDIEVTIWRDPSPRTRTAVVEIREAARLAPDDLERSLTDFFQSRTTSVIVSSNGNQYLISREDPADRTWTIRVSGRMRVPALTIENSRTSFVSPKFGDVRFCSFLSDGSTTEPVDVERFRDEYFCDVGPEFSSSVEMQIEGYLRRATRLDYSEPDPAEAEGTTLRWQTNEPDLGFRARASYADIGTEASVQRYLFASGVVVGLAAAAAPISVELLRGPLSELGKRIRRKGAQARETQ